MAQLITSANTYSLFEASITPDCQITLSNGGKSLGSMPTLYDKNGHFVSIMHSWFFDLKAVKFLNNLNSYSRILLSYWSFLEENQLYWDKSPPIKRLKPTYLYRHYLLTKIKECQIARRTANHYINHVVKFYILAIQESFCRW